MKQSEVHFVMSFVENWLIISQFKVIIERRRVLPVCSPGSPGSLGSSYSPETYRVRLTVDHRCECEVEWWFDCQE